MKPKMKVFMRFVSISLSLMFVLLYGTACGNQAKQTTGIEENQSQSVQPQNGGTLKGVENAEGAMPLGVPWEVRGLDTKLQKPAVESLIREDINGNYTPWLAEAWKVDTDKGTVTLSLKKGLKFHDGTDFNAEAVRWNLQHQIDAKNVTGWKSVEVVDDYSVRINLQQYTNSILNVLAGSYGGIVSPSAFQKNGIEWARWNPVGTGPFKFASYDRGNVLKYIKNDTYWITGLPYLDGIEYRFIKDPMTQQAALKTAGAERIDVLNTTSPEQAAMLKSDGFEVVGMPTGPLALFPDSKDPKSPLADKRVRDAISYAIDREGIIKARGFGYWAPAYQLPGVDTPSYVKDFNQSFDPNKAKQLLAEAGYPNAVLSGYSLVVGL